MSLTKGLHIHEARKHLDAGDFTAEELTRQTLQAISEKDPLINSYITVAEESAMADARLADEKIRKGEAGALTGIPLGLKDLILTRGIRTTCASRMLENFDPPYSGTVAEKLKDAGAVITGKLNLDEFAMGSSSETSWFGPVKNPWNLSHIPGGSSGGSAAAVAAGLCLGSLGTDTGGSIRQPAAHCGVVGLKPSYGRVSRYGVVAFASSLDQVGPMARSVEDCAILLQAIAGHDPKDSTSVNVPVPDYYSLLSKDLKGLTIGLPVEYHGAEGVHPEIRSAIGEAVRVLEASGAKTVEVRLPHMAYAVAAYYVVASSEASTNLARFDGIRYGYRTPEAASLLELYEKSRSEGFGEEVRRRILVGTYALSSGYYDAYYNKALKVRALIAKDFTDAFAGCDLIAAPVTPAPAFALGEVADDPLTMYLADIFTISANLAGIPGMSVPCGFSAKGLPMGLQLLGKPFDEATLLKAAYAYEKEAAWDRGLADPAAGEKS
ncbi:aspartyl/glutamyl-tRNA(Asn/Gln) amidotransferase subunit A [Desulfobotulus alkaliphilus]|uniref:Glutamyl-tRNA(Gln) amidotransferase subunit A n=1 Tax=Desulfobotulus alkaliphilus TaxID=622671 RepID=A0A562RI03_9BACT|nr:Asp-tRNA(Asn)/Glu-tRNA(Gln) amidotransferase subunit GatA [Desulfobotulus alkaliphilus]TWI68503.1 aspartyl/glutamyl-tRNA(Asn/Gln) amidotransferase subunit A [Desulfobotulus alkaliphilus]